MGETTAYQQHPVNIWFTQGDRFKVLKMDLYMQYIFLHMRGQFHTNSATFCDTVGIYILMRNKLLLRKSQDYDTISIILYRFWNILLRILQIQKIEHTSLTKIVRKSREKKKKKSPILSKWEYFCQNWRIIILRKFENIFYLFLQIFLWLLSGCIVLCALQWNV